MRNYLRIGEIVQPSGLGKTASWDRGFGIVTEVSETSVYVAWKNLEYQEEMQFDEVTATGCFADSLPDDLRFIREPESEDDELVVEIDKEAPV